MSHNNDHYKLQNLKKKSLVNFLRGSLMITKFKF